MVGEDTPSPSNSGIIQEFQQEQAALTGHECHEPAGQTQESEPTQLAGYTPHNANYEVLRDFQQELESSAGIQEDRAAVQTLDQELNPSRPGVLRQADFVQAHDGGVPSNDIVAFRNDRMLNEGKELPPSSRSSSDMLVDQKAAEIQARERNIAENDQNKEKQVSELAERSSTVQNTQSPQTQREQEREAERRLSRERDGRER